ncbi:MAG: hypothetical protein Q9166_000480 [cf. Caloplaca sp. 2 TL-2023]
MAEVPPAANEPAIEADPEAELDRLDLTHQKLKILLEDKLLLCPAEKPARVLDVGTGTGIWAIEYGILYLESKEPTASD